ncbi:ATP-binding protein [Falsigemmobacter faecalis]|nr:ATP-binding protein [Falsigemmobacter faecalis]
MTALQRLAQHLRPRGLAAQFALLLMGAIAAAQLLALLLFAGEGSDFDRQARMHQDLGRLIALLHAVEQADEDVVTEIIEQSNTGYTRFFLAEEPLDTAGATPLLNLAADLRRATPGNTVLVHSPGVADLRPDQPVLMMISIGINAGPFRGEWLNSLVYPLPHSLAWPRKWGFVIPLLMSAAGCLAVALYFTRQLTRPLARAAETARLAGAGDHSQRLTVSGPAELQDFARAFNAMQAQIAGFEATRRTILAAVGHDIRTPVTSLRLRAEFIEDPELREGMIRSLEEISVITEDLLGSVRRISDQEGLRDTDLTALLQDLCEETGVRFLGGPPLILPLREVAMRRALRNLMVNAMRYARDAEAVMQLGSDITLELRDRGPGLSAEKLALLNRPFEAASGGRQFAGGGTGLGLAICESVLRAHGGTLTLKNREGGGLSAVVRLPLPAPAQASSEGASASG